MAEYIMKSLVDSSRFEIASAATSREEIGNPVYPPARRKLFEHGIHCDGHAARQMTKSDYSRYDRIIGMDRANIRNILRMTGGDPDHKISMLLDYTEKAGQEVSDPWYTGDFEAAWQDIALGCAGLLAELNQTEA